MALIHFHNVSFFIVDFLCIFTFKLKRFANESFESYYSCTRGEEESSDVAH